uniref:guanylate cyclase n=1 Tax=Saccoglossus kowalevskii TaxID=10224 RepID=A0ABM0MJ06_SACKO|nr:PREDICTED: atrial natriuretic peptide receptor 1-like [Saccoglossus kowalevskii]
MNSNVNRNPDFYLFHIQNNQYRSVAIEFNVEELFVENPNNPIIWPDGTTTAPPAVPECGFNGCPYDPTILTVSLVIPTVTVAVLVIIICCIYGKKKRERDIANMLWKVKYEDIHIGLPRSFSHSSGIRFGRVAGLNSRNKLLGKDSRTTVSGMNSFASFAAKQNQLFAQIGTYKGTIVAISSLNPNRFNLTKDVMSDLKSDIIANEDINIDVMFKISFTTDIIKGMEYLHKSSVRSHGYLKSSNCVVDSRWVVKITDYGVLNTAFKDDSLSDYQLYTRQLWTAPELLRMANPPAKGTQKGDVYSFAILVQEIVFRSEPYYLNEEEPQDIIERVTKLENPPYRPYLPHDIDASSAEVIPLVLKCWSEDPQERPDFTQIRKTAHILNKGRRAHILDNMIEMMEKYTSNLEEIVAERTDELIREKKKTDMLLYKLLPISVAEQLKSGQSVSAETFDSVSLFFSDIVSFTEIAAQSTPMQGKGTQTTYWLTGKQGYEKQLPKWDRESLDSTDSAVAGLMDSPVLSVKK